MNERIKELEKQAIEYSWNQRNSGLDLDAIMREKFSELIVKECMALNSKELSILAIERLLPLYQEHFGVEK